MAAELVREGSVADPSTIYALAQRDWHVRGQTGCMFARIAALQALTLRWDYTVIRDLSMEYSGAIERYLSGIHSDPRIELASLLFPEVTAAEQAVDIVRNLVAATSFWLERDETRTGAQHLHVRYPVGTPGRTVQAWVMGFAPFKFVPNTRRGPYFELAIRVKEKPDRIFHRLTQDRDVAHLADVPLTMSDRHWEDRWQSTLARTRMILGGEPNEVSAAKSTLVVPTDLLRAGNGAA